jgi:hypothetical protein
MAVATRNAIAMMPMMTATLKRRRSRFGLCI